MAKHAMNMINNDKLKLVDIQKKSPRSQLAQPFMYCITSTLIRFFFLSNNFHILQTLSITTK